MVPEIKQPKTPIDLFQEINRLATQIETRGETNKLKTPMELIAKINELKTPMEPVGEINNLKTPMDALVDLWISVSKFALPSLLEFLVLVLLDVLKDALEIHKMPLPSPMQCSKV